MVYTSASINYYIFYIVLRRGWALEKKCQAFARVLHTLNGIYLLDLRHYIDQDIAPWLGNKSERGVIYDTNHAVLDLSTDRLFDERLAKRCVKPCAI
jgi:hypothetical protein